VLSSYGRTAPVHIDDFYKIRRKNIYMGFTIAVVGKGGTGKTTVCGALARTFGALGRRVLAVDADPDANLASVLPLIANTARVPLAKQKKRIRAVIDPEGKLPTPFLILNPDVTGLLDELYISWGDRHRLLTLGWHKGGGEGCYCEENIVLQEVLRLALSQNEDIVLIDGEAGLEQLSRGTLRQADVILVVIEPGQRSVQTAFDARRLAADLGIGSVYCVLNGYESKEEVTAVQKLLGEWQLAAALPREEAIRSADLAGACPPLSGQWELETRILAAYLLAE
jgi:CO dehydrogenase maturation factor